MSGALAELFSGAKVVVAPAVRPSVPKSWREPPTLKTFGVAVLVKSAVKRYQSPRIRLKLALCVLLKVPVFGPAGTGACPAWTCQVKVPKGVLGTGKMRALMKSATAGAPPFN